MQSGRRRWPIVGARQEQACRECPDLFGPVVQDLCDLLRGLWRADLLQYVQRVVLDPPAGGSRLASHPID